MNQTVNCYFPQGMALISPSASAMLRIDINYFKKGSIRPMPSSCGCLQLTGGYQGFKCSFDGRIINLECPPAFVDVFPHTPDSKAEAIILLEDSEFFSGQFECGQSLDLWYFNEIKKRYYLVGNGVIDSVIDSKLVRWTLGNFIKRYRTKLSLSQDLDAFEIDAADAFSRLTFVDSIRIAKTHDPEKSVKVAITTKWPLERRHVAQLLKLSKYLSYEAFRYRIDYRNNVTIGGVVTYDDLILSMATWGKREFVTIVLEVKSTL